MKIKEELDLSVLLEYGFEEIDKEEYKNRDDTTLSHYDYNYNLGHSRRGQLYYLLVNKDNRQLVIYATEPDGSGGSIRLDDVLLRMFKDNLFE